jgi:hypothetical protein
MSSPKKNNPAVPSKVRIFGKVIHVFREDMPKEEFGEYHQHEYKITISKRLGTDDALHTLFHECIHAALHISGLSEMLPGPNGSDDDKTADLEEAIVTCLENALYDMVDIEKIRVD